MTPNHDDLSNAISLLAIVISIASLLVGRR